MTYNEILKMVKDAVDCAWFRGYANDYENLKKVILKCATDIYIYIEQMRERANKKMNKYILLDVDQYLAVLSLLITVLFIIFAIVYFVSNPSEEVINKCLSRRKSVI